jgi:hypothetical protein
MNPLSACNDAVVRKEVSSAEAAAINAVLLEFFSEVYDKTGYARPSGLHGFPPGPPLPCQRRRHLEAEVRVRCRSVGAL